MIVATCAALLGPVLCSLAGQERYAEEIQLTHGPGGRVLTNTRTWSPDGRWLAFDTRFDGTGGPAEATEIKLVDTHTGQLQTVYTSRNQAQCFVVTFHPHRNRVVFILGPEHPTPDWKYGFAHRQGVIVDLDKPGHALNLDARDIVAPYTPGALRGGSHVHVYSPDGRFVSFTYNDHVLPTDPPADRIYTDLDQRNIGVTDLSAAPVTVPETHARNHNGAGFTALISRTVNNPRPGSDEISKAYEDGWVGTKGYLRTDGKHQRYAIAFLGDVITADGQKITELFLADLPDDLTRPSTDGPLQGTETARPAPPEGVTQRRLTHTANRKHPGIVANPRHWVRTNPQGTHIAFLMQDDAGIVQIYTVSPNGGEPVQLTHNPFGVSSVINWSPDGKHIAFAADRSVFDVEVATNMSRRITRRAEEPEEGPAPECLDYSPDGKRLAYLKSVKDPVDGKQYPQIFITKTN